MSLAPSRVGRTDNHQEWEALKQSILTAYLDEDRTLKVVREHMRQEFGFEASEAQYKRRLQRWGIHKNVTSSVMDSVIETLADTHPRELQQRSRDRKFSVHGNNVVPAEIKLSQVKRYVRRKSRQGTSQRRSKKTALDESETTEPATILNLEQDENDVVDDVSRTDQALFSSHQGTSTKRSDSRNEMPRGGLSPNPRSLRSTSRETATSRGAAQLGRSATPLQVSKAELPSENEPPVHRQFACPFNKYDPVTFAPQTKRNWQFTSCPKPFTTINRLREHLQKDHFRNMTSCKHCGETFQDGTNLAHHMQLSNACKIEPPTSIGMMTEDASKRVRQAIFPKGSEIENWYFMWDTIFAGQKKPKNPFSDPGSGEAREHFANLFQALGPIQSAKFLSVRLPEKTKRVVQQAYDHIYGDDVIAPSHFNTIEPTRLVRHPKPLGRGDSHG